MPEFFKRLEELVTSDGFESNSDFTDEHKKILKGYFKSKKAEEIFPVEINKNHTIDIDNSTCSHCDEHADYDSIRANLIRPNENMITLELMSYCNNCKHFFKSLYRYKSLKEGSLKIEFLSPKGHWISKTIEHNNSIKYTILNYFKSFFK